MKIKFKKNSDSIEIIDPIERHREQVIIQKPITIEHTEWNPVQYPVDRAITITTDQFTLPNTGTINVRGKNRKIVSEINPNKNLYLPDGEYILEMSKSIKIYIRIGSSLDIKSSKSKKKIKLADETDIIIGARSYHTQPAGTIVTTSLPTDVMQAVSAFGSAMKTAKSERSYPTLRGHPPLIKLGDTLNIPSELKQSDTRIWFELPPKLHYIYTIAPLAYYLGAEVIPGSNPRLITENGYSFSLNESGEFESTVERILRQVFFLDCIVRTEGHSPGSVYERQMIESELEFDLSMAYNQSFAERIENYLEAPFSIIESHYPRWNPRTRIQPIGENVEFLPFIAESLSIVSTKVEESELFPSKQTQLEAAEFPNLKNQIDEPIIQQEWNCNDSYKIQSTTPLMAYYNNLDRKPKEEPLKIEVICNDSNMSAELVTAHSAYGNRSELPFSVTIHHDLTTDQLRSSLVCESDFTHYIGHIDKDGFRCTDGNLDAASLKNVNSKLFFLNACHSHDQGLELIKAGSIGGIVTDGEIQNDHAVDIGSTIARLLNLGYPLYATVDIARVGSSVGDQYHIVGDGSTSIAQSKTTVPNSCSIVQRRNKPEAMINLYPSKESKKGCLFIPSIGSIEEYHLVQQDIGPYPITKAELIKFLDINPIPVVVDGSMYWSDNLGIKDV